MPLVTVSLADRNWESGKNNEKGSENGSCNLILTQFVFMFHRTFANHEFVILFEYTLSGLAWPQLASSLLYVYIYTYIYLHLYMMIYNVQFYNTCSSTDPSGEPKYAFSALSMNNPVSTTPTNILMS